MARLMNIENIENIVTIHGEPLTVYFEEDRVYVPHVKMLTPQMCAGHLRLAAKQEQAQQETPMRLGPSPLVEYTAGPKPVFEADGDMTKSVTLWRQL